MQGAATQVVPHKNASYMLHTVWLVLDLPVRTGSGRRWFTETPTSVALSAVTIPLAVDQCKAG